MRIFLAGIIQGSKRELEIHSQDYRQTLTDLLHQYIPEADVYDPFAENHDSVTYSDEKGRQVFFHHNALCREMDAIIAFVPEASMGTAIEIWEGWHHNVAIFIVTPLKTNWVVRFLSHRVYDSLEDLAADIRSGEFVRVVQQVRGGSQSQTTPKTPVE